MSLLRRFVAPACATALILAGLCACGDDTRLPEVPSSTPFSTNTVAVTQQGNAKARIDPSSLTLKLDDTRTLVAHLTLRSTASSTTAISVRGSLYDPHHALIGDLSGGVVNVAPGATTAVQLTGPTPLGTIASVTFELTATPTGP